jgi:iron complex transport system substrate-binding protein
MTVVVLRIRALMATRGLALSLALTPSGPALTEPVSPAAAAGPSSSAPSSGPIVIRDDVHREITLLHSPQRIISLLPALTETVCALGECGRLVATDRYSNWPESVSSLPKTGGLDDPLIEAIVRLHPDLVLLSSSQRITGRLRELGIESFALDTQTYAQISRVIAVIGTILDVPARAAALNHRIDDEMRQIAEQAIARRRGPAPTVYFEVDPGPYAAGPQSFIGELLTRLGARNIVDADLGLFPKLNPEYVVRRNPDVIFVSPADAPHLTDRPGWDRIRAVREKRLCSFPPDVRDTIVHGGPRIADGMRAIADCLARVWP